MANSSTKKKVLGRGLVSTAIATGLILGASGTASAATFNNSYGGQDRQSGADTVLNYNRGHASFVLRLTVDGLALDENYQITMYDGSRVVWSSNVNNPGNALTGRPQGSQSYSVGGNVTKIVVNPNSGLSLVSWGRA
ncbi:hypothetical protein ABZU78_25465 [Rhodococcus erythropolis]|uniref:hypothetical protein n=1 Tax=Rhodococcus erythropolis TaxID=1833 RepID=UPI0033B9E93C